MKQSLFPPFIPCFKALVTLSLFACLQAFSATVVPPKPITSVTPKYPESLFAQALVGSVKLKTTISAEGQPSNIVVVEASHPDFGASAVTALEQWVFQPATKDGISSALTIHIPFTFNPPQQAPEANQPVQTKPGTDPKLVQALGRDPFVELNPAIPLIKSNVLGMENVRKNLVSEKRSYPSKLIGSGKTAKARVSYVIDTDGKVINPTIIEIDDPAFRAAVLRTLVDMKYKPFKQDGQLVYVEVKRQIQIAEKGAGNRPNQGQNKKKPVQR